MKTRSSILDELVSSIDTRRVEVKLSTIAKAAVAGGIAKSLLTKKLPKVSKYSTPKSILQYAKSLVSAKDHKEQVAATVGLLSVAGNVLLKISDLRDLGFKIMQVVQSERFEEFISKD